MSQAGETFFTSVGCMDGRSECTIAKWGRGKFGVKYADAITEAGMVGLLAHNPSEDLLASVKKKITISVDKHGSKNIVISGHEDCAGNPVENEKHKKDILQSAILLRQMFPAVRIVPVFVKRFRDDWIVEEL